MRVCVFVEGIVQGVGFRPFVYRLANALSLAGSVCNTESGVTIEIEGRGEAVESFLERLNTDAPPRSQIRRVRFEEIAPLGERAFVIEQSRSGGRATALVPADIATCDDCLRELFDPDDPRYRYPFINCTNCGPRYTIIQGLPYDREKTTMRVFEMCPFCKGEYTAPENRRYHAEPVACPQCGPQLALVNAAGAPIETNTPIVETRRLLREGKIVAIKGLGGFHLACDSTRPEAVRRLRRRKRREEKPFAMMVRDLDALRAFAAVNDEEATLLASPERPIVLLDRREDGPIAPEVAPRSKYLGAMLPYTPVHALLFERECPPLVMTSGNLTDEPIAIDNVEARERLGTIADAFLENDRDIYLSNDDSVARVFRGRPILLRRSRGYVPMPVELPTDGDDVLAVGAHLKNTIAIAKGPYAFLSQHIGDLETAASLAAFERTAEHLAALLEATPSAVACDLHPDYFSTRYARGLGLPVLAVQHHHAHVAAVCAARGIHERVIGVALDGTGYGPDGTIWGGELLVADLVDFERVGHLETVALPGGDAAIKHPNRIALSFLHACFKGDIPQGLPLLDAMPQEECRTIRQMLDSSFRCTPTSSCGRLFDAVSALLGVVDHASYEGQPAIELEGIADHDADGAYDLPLTQKDAQVVLLSTRLFRQVLDDHRAGVDPSAMSMRFHRALANGIADAVSLVSKRTGIRKAVLAGGCFQNMTLLDMLLSRLADNGLDAIFGETVPPNDGAIALGQAAVARARMGA